MIFAVRKQSTLECKCMKAKFATSCASCGDKIQPGKEISKNKDEKWVHKHCAEDLEGLP